MSSPRGEPCAPLLPRRFSYATAALEDDPPAIGGVVACGSSQPHAVDPSDENAAGCKGVARRTVTVQREEVRCAVGVTKGMSRLAIDRRRWDEDESAKTSRQ
ncbi:hypothetical protein GCM10010517_26390 [Streptosporangium fragile]|uniref:Uncharacterized protein n=1 Tax=Streptosporangium fragile TaxID=46186 RepID=A0ABN3VV93_9ACTN